MVLEDEGRGNIELKLKPLYKEKLAKKFFDKLVDDDSLDVDIVIEDITDNELEKEFLNELADFMYNN